MEFINASELSAAEITAGLLDGTLTRWRSDDSGQWYKAGNGLAEIRGVPRETKLIEAEGAESDLQLLIKHWPALSSAAKTEIVAIAATDEGEIIAESDEEDLPAWMEDFGATEVDTEDDEDDDN